MNGHEHLDWCVERAMVYANDGDLAQAWASFVSDVRKHDATAYIGNSQMTAKVMLRQVSENASPEEFRRYIAGWNPDD